MRKVSILIITLLFLQSCQVINKFASNSISPTEQEIVLGLRKALHEASKLAVSELTKKDGYFGNDNVKIDLPDDIKNIFNVALNNRLVKNMNLDTKLQQKIDEFELAVNRTAESAAKEALPIFINCVNSLTISDGLNILQGTDTRGQIQGFDSLAATHYLDLKARNELFLIFQPKMDSLLDTDLGLGISANTAWNNLTTYYNSIIAPVLKKQKIDYTLSEYSTNPNRHRTTYN